MSKLERVENFFERVYCSPVYISSSVLAGLLRAWCVLVYVGGSPRNDGWDWMVIVALYLYKVRLSI